MYTVGKHMGQYLRKMQRFLAQIIMHNQFCAGHYVSERELTTIFYISFSRLGIYKKIPWDPTPHPQ